MSMKVREKATSGPRDSTQEGTKSGSYCRQAAACNVRVMAMATEGQCVSTNVRPKTNRLIACPHNDITSPKPTTCFQLRKTAIYIQHLPKLNGFHPPILDDLVNTQAHASENR